MVRILVVGLITVDVVYGVEAYPAEGEKLRAEDAHVVAGGGALYAAAAIARLGGEASLVGAIGDDLFGRFLRGALEALGIRQDHVRTLAQVPTSHSAILISDAGERTIVNHRNPMLFEHLPDTSAVADTDAVLADTRWPAGAARLLRAARAAGKPAVLDAEAPLGAAGDALAAASHIAFSEQGLRDVSERPAAEALAEVHESTGAWAAVTRGAASVLCRYRVGAEAIAPPEVRAVDTLGAGDVWHGAFTLALARGVPEPEAVRYANAAAALKTTRTGGADTFPTDDEVRAFLKDAPIA